MRFHFKQVFHSLHLLNYQAKDQNFPICTSHIWQDSLCFIQTCHPLRPLPVRHAILSGHNPTNSCKQSSGFSCSFTAKLSSLLRWNPRPRQWSSGSAPSTLSFQPISMEEQWWPITHMTSPLSTGSEVSAALPIPPRLMTHFSRRYAEWLPVQPEELGA